MNEALMAAVLMGVGSGAAYFLCAPQCIALMAGLGGAALVEPATQYVQIRAVGLVAVLLSSVLQVPPALRLSRAHVSSFQFLTSIFTTV
jgi:Na+-driven multidrug efflux pump